MLQNAIMMSTEYLPKIQAETERLKHHKTTDITLKSSTIV